MTNIWLRAAGPLLYAHRGASKERPENTIPSFQRGIELGADVLELDVHPSRDGTFVVSHDPDGERTCGVPRPIADCTWAELSGWDAGFGFVDERGARPFAGTGIRLARFDEVLDEFPATPLNVDVKLASSNEVQRLTALIHARGAEGRVLLTSFSWRCLRRVARAGYGGPRGLSRLDVVGLRFAPAALLQRRSERRVQIPEHAGPVDLSARWFIERCQSLGLGVDYWVVNAPERARALLEAGADGIFTDDVAAIAALFREALQTAAWRERHLDLDLRQAKVRWRPLGLRLADAPEYDKDTAEARAAFLKELGITKGDAAGAALAALSPIVSAVLTMALGGD